MSNRRALIHVVENNSPRWTYRFDLELTKRPATTTPNRLISEASSFSETGDGPSTSEQDQMWAPTRNLLNLSAKSNRTGSYQLFQQGLRKLICFYLFFSVLVGCCWTDGHVCMCESQHPSRRVACDPFRSSRRSSGSVGRGSESVTEAGMK